MEQNTNTMLNDLLSDPAKLQSALSAASSLFGGSSGAASPAPPPVLRRRRAFLQPHPRL